jgi:hypothetical protein
MSFKTKLTKEQIKKHPYCVMDCKSEDITYEEGSSYEPLCAYHNDRIIWVLFQKSITESNKEEIYILTQIHIGFGHIFNQKITKEFTTKLYNDFTWENCTEIWDDKVIETN